MGMTASSWEGWAEQHVNPHVAIAYFFVPNALAIATVAYLCTGIRGDDHMYYVVLVTLVVFVLFHTGTQFAFWRWGPNFAHSKVFQHVMVLTTVCSMPILYVGFLGPDSTVPWNDRLHYVSVHGLAIFFLLQGAASGGMAGEHPAEPRTSIWEPFCRSAVQALTLVDAASDFALTRSLLAAVCPPLVY